ncbi:MAG: amidohydrolase family protein [Bryobacteraceae bacterium]|nr:amidohydrolase family protein [Bryobacteraceae bacterium]
MRKAICTRLRGCGGGRLAAVLGTAALLAPAMHAAAPTVIAIRNAKVVTVSGPVLAKGTVVVRDGLIEAVGENVTVPPGAWVVEADGLTVYPGLMTGLSTWGIPQPAPVPSAGGAAGALQALTRGTATAPGQPAPPPARGPEDRPATTSWQRAADLIQMSDRRLETARSAGFTTSATFPNRGIITGHGAVINLAGANTGSMVLNTSAGLFTTTQTAGFSNFPGSLMGVIAYIRQVYLDLEHYEMVKADYAKSPLGKKRPVYDRALEGVAAAPRVLMPAVNAVQIDRMLRLAADLKVKPVLYGVHEAYKTAELIRKSGAPVLVNVSWPERERDADPDVEETLDVLELRENAPASPAALAKAGVKFAFYANDNAQPRDFLRNVKKAIEAGLPFDQAVRALTLSPAEIYGVSDRLGSIEKGKIANLVVTKGDLFQDATRVEFVLIDGQRFEPAPELPGAGNPFATTPSAEELEELWRLLWGEEGDAHSHSPRGVIE